MPSKAQPEVNLWFLYVCLQKSDYKTVSIRPGSQSITPHRGEVSTRGVSSTDYGRVQIDFQAVSRETNFSPAAARRRFARLKKQIEKNASDTAKDTPVPPDQASKATAKSTTKAQPHSEASGSKQPKHEPFSSESSLRCWDQTSRGVVLGSAETPALSRRVGGPSTMGGLAAHVDLTKEHEDGARLNQDDSSDDDAPLMKKRRIAGPSSILRSIPNHKSASVSDNAQNVNFPSQTAERNPSQSLLPAQRRRTVKEFLSSKDGQCRTDHKAGIVRSAIVTAPPRTSEAQMVDLTGEETPARIINGAEGTSGTSTIRGTSAQELSDCNGTDVLPSIFSEHQDLSLFGDELFSSFLGSTPDLQNVATRDILDDYDPRTAWQQQTSPLSSFGAQVSSALPQTSNSRRESFMSIDDERPAYSWALRRLDRPDLAVPDHSYEQRIV
jgi:hypothetical protein